GMCFVLVICYKVVHAYVLIIHFFFFFNDTATTEIYTLSLHDALPISMFTADVPGGLGGVRAVDLCPLDHGHHLHLDRKSTRLNSSHGSISYAVFCLKKKKKRHTFSVLQMKQSTLRTQP